VTLNVTTASAPNLTVTPNTLTFDFQTGGATPAAQPVSVGSTGTALSYTVTTSTISGGNWLSATPAGGTTPGTEDVSVDPTGLAAGDYTGNVTISSSGAGNSPQTVAVTLAILSTTAQYRLTGWSELGMHCIDGKDYSILSVLPPYNIIRAQLMTLAEPPIPVSSGVTITYQALADSSGSINTISSTKTNFWNWDHLLFPNPIPGVVTLVNPARNVGLTGNRVQSLRPYPLKYNSTQGYWEATAVPTVPYDDKGVYHPYPMVQLTAKDPSGKVLATAPIVLSVSDDMSCSTCHASNSDPDAEPAGGWVNNPNPAKDTRLNILRKHDDLNNISGYLTELAAKGFNYRSTLEATANAGTPVLCSACHATNALAETGLAGINPLTQDMHSFHGPQINHATGTTLDQEAATSPATSCYLCHPGINTRCQRGAMSPIACASCHGNLAGTVPGTSGTYVGQATRTGWLTEPACQMCHQNSNRFVTTLDSSDLWRSSTDATFATNQNVPAAGFQLYRYSKGHGSLYCSSCHGSPHAEFPTTQVNDNVYSTNLQGYQGAVRECGTCHNPVPLTKAGGPHGMHAVGQSWVNSHRHYVGENRAACRYCHGADYRGTFLSQLKIAKTFQAGDFGTKTFPAGHMISCYDCHNGPGGGDD